MPAPLVQDSSFAPPDPRGRVFAAWLVAFYFAYLAAVPLAWGWGAVGPHWPIGAMMILGSYFAGSTPVGGGGVAFPVLVLAFGHTAALGRCFSFAVQSLGMSSATLFLWCKRRPVDAAFLRPALPGTLLGTPLGSVFLVPLLQDITVKLLFASVWAAFGVFAIWRLRTLSTAREPASERPAAAFTLGLLGGATVGAILGSGVDMLAFVYLVLRRRVEVATAIRTGMVLMAATSIVGIGTALAQGVVPPEVLGPWLAAAPVVVVGAPLGALLVGLIPRRVTLAIVSFLCVMQFAWMWASARPEGRQAVAAIGAVVLTLGLFVWLDRRGGQAPDRYPAAT